MVKTRYTICTALLITVCWQSAAGAAELNIAPDRILETLVREHPRLMLKEDALRDLKERAENDQVLQHFVSEIFKRADDRLDEPKLIYEKRGPRLLHVSKACLERIYDLGIAWRWTGGKKYAEKIKENLLAVCDFPDWNPSHFLDTAEMSHAVGIGCDWTYDYLDEKTRDRIRAALVELGLKPGIERYKSAYKHFTYAYNWNQVCNGGLLIGAAAIAESEPETAEFVIRNALENLPIALGSYAPDGVWAEGIGYWNYATSYTAFALTALQTSLGSDFGLSKAPGLAQTGYVPIYFASPAGLLFSYADAGDFKKRETAACMFWLARTFGNSQFSDSEHDLLQAGKVDPFHVIWYTPPSGKTPSTRDLDCLLRGQVETALFRSDWNDPDALFVGVKAGYNQAHYGHLDLGNFEMDALGVRWARDLGSDNYNLPDYFNYRQGGTRWTYYRLNSFSHNVPVLGGKNQNANAAARVTRFESNEAFSFATINLTEAYAAHTTEAMRGVAMVGKRRAVLVQDEFEIVNPCQVLWGMTTDAAITLEKPGLARLSLKGRQLYARVLSPAGASFAIESGEQSPPQERNEGVSRLVVCLPETQGRITIVILLSPQWKDGVSISTAAVKPLKKWNTDF
ncbi:MAG: heparinase II/III-family protein [Planctomycetaceae bacterium]|nr:heparinase II/III-family protein [Planctomycetaceae bacterium]